MKYDLRNATFDEFVDFIFIREPDEPSLHLYHSDYDFDPTMFVGFYTRLFRDSGFLPERFTRKQLEEGFWTIGGPTDLALKWLLYDTSVAIAQREDCVKSMYQLYRDLFAVSEFDMATWMWWDQMAYPFGHGLDDEFHPFQKGETERLLQDAMFETLCEILKLPSLACQWRALHGFNHLCHPDTEPVLRRYLAEHPEFDVKDKAFIERCIIGENE